MATNAGFLLIAGLGAFLLFGQRKTPPAEGTIEELGLTSVPVATASLADVNGTSKIVEILTVESMGETITPTELAVRRSEQIDKQAFIWAANSIPATGPTQGDIDAIKIEKGTFVYGGAKRPTPTAIPVWNNRYGWYWVDPPTGRAVGAGGKLWSSSDTSMHRGSPSVNIGPTLPPGWTPNAGGSANFTGTQRTRAQDIGF